MYQAFLDLDTDGSGFITVDELAHQLKQLEMTSTEDEVKELIKQADLNNDGQIDYTEFVTMMAPKLLGYSPDDLAYNKNKELKRKGYR